MSANLVPSELQGAAAIQQVTPGSRGWEGSPAASDSTSGIAAEITRALGAIRRYFWLIVGIVAAGSSVGYALTRWVKPSYDVTATIWVAKNAAMSGPILAPGLLTDAIAWVELARSWIVLDQVVARLELYVRPAQAADSSLLKGLVPSERLQAGSYRLSIDPSARTYALTRVAADGRAPDVRVESGVLGDSIGRSIGVLWQPPAERFTDARDVVFTVVTPREAALSLSQRLIVVLPQLSSLMRFSLSGDDPRQLEMTLNTILDVFIKEAARLKRENLSAVARTVEEQLGQAKEQLNRATAALESFKFNTITMPSENTPIAPGVAMATNPVFQDFFQQNVAYKALQRDREALERILKDADANGGRISVEALKALPPVLQGNTDLNNELSNLAALMAQVRSMEFRYTDSFPPLQALRAQIARAETQTIPQIARNSLAQMRTQEDDMRRRIDGAAVEIREIPQRTIEEMNRQREVNIADRIYTDLFQRSTQARLAEMSELPDISILDRAVAPLSPSSDTALAILAAAIGGSLVAGILLALLLDRLDKRFRYPQQATRDLGLDIVGAIPTLSNPRNSSVRLQQASQLVESFRSLSLSIRSAFDGIGPIQLTVSSPGPGDGKSFVSANLASALADGGFRTVLIDGDIRRGTLHSVFPPITQAPGLLEYLAGDASLSEVLRSTANANLVVLPCGNRRRRGPELLASEAMTALIRNLRTQFDAIVIDSAPLGAGIDPYALGVATGSMLLVLRTGETDRRLAQSKLEVLDRLPVRILGTVLNDIGQNPQFKYYYYLEGYSSSDQTALVGDGASRD